MAGDLGTLSKRFNRAADRVPEAGSKAAAKVAEAILNDLAFVTPVDESTARSNWQVALNTPISDSDEIGPYYLGSHGSTGQASAQAAVAAGRAVLATKKPGETIYVSNVLDYIVPLDEGHSQQEPAGFVHRAVLVGRKTVAKIRLGLFR
jgi:hypothetical protein